MEFFLKKNQIKRVKFILWVLEIVMKILVKVFHILVMALKELLMNWKTFQIIKTKANFWIYTFLNFCIAFCFWIILLNYDTDLLINTYENIFLQKIVRRKKKTIRKIVPILAKKTVQKNESITLYLFSLEEQLISVLCV